MDHERSALRLDENSCKSLREIVFDTIRSAIIQGKFLPGERLMEVQLADELGVSRTPVREAIRKLELEGLVKMEPRKGAYVTPMSAVDLKEMMEVRRALEGLCAELAAQNATEEDIQWMRETNRDFEAAALANDEHGVVYYDTAFHDCIFESTGNERLYQMIHSLREQMLRMRVEYVHHIVDRSHLVGQHDKIIESIAQHKPEDAARYATEHIKEAEKDMFMVLNRKGE